MKWTGGKQMWIHLAVCLGFAAGAGTGCGSVPSQLPDAGLPLLAVTQVEPVTVLPGTWVRVIGEGFVEPSMGVLAVELRAAGITHPVATQWVSASEVTFEIDRALFNTLGGSGAFQGELILEISYSGGIYQRSETPLSLTLQESLRPRLGLFTPTTENATYLGSSAQATGQGFLLRGEGITELRLNGFFTPQEGQGREISGVAVLRPAGRELLQGPLPADALGIEPGRFKGDVVPVNLHAGGVELEGPGLQGATIQLAPTAITLVEPTIASRGQWFDFVGRGFVGGSATTAIRIDGAFTSTEGQVLRFSGDDALVVTPELLSGDTLRYKLRVSPDGYGGVQGLGAVSGVLSGTFTPVVYHRQGFREGIAGPGDIELTILPQKQVVYVKYLPGFTDATREFGLRNVENLIRARILEVLHRDYQGINVEFRLDRPADYIEYCVIEIGGEDPNHMGLLGLDNSMLSKDTGNVFFNDVIGGVNAENSEDGHFAYGGVFVTSFLAFSPRHQIPLPIASVVFDEVFGPFIPRWGGQAVEPNELSSGHRVDLILRAVLSLGNMLGNTISHEIGHTLGLADGPAGMLHNLVPADNQIMDSGIHRDFLERAELYGRGPARWTDKNRRYLERILPK